MSDQRIKLVKGDFNHNGDGKHSDCGHWIAGDIPVGSTGTVRLVKDAYPQYGGTETGPYCIIWDHAPEPKARYYWGYTPSYKYETIENRLNCPQIARTIARSPCPWLQFRNDP